jgi:hypothetical protein
MATLKFDEQSLGQWEHTATRGPEVADERQEKSQLVSAFSALQACGRCLKSSEVVQCERRFDGRNRLFA